MSSHQRGYRCVHCGALATNETYPFCRDCRAEVSHTNEMIRGLRLVPPDGGPRRCVRLVIEVDGVPLLNATEEELEELEPFAWVLVDMARALIAEAAFWPPRVRPGASL